MFFNGRNACWATDRVSYCGCYHLSLSSLLKKVGFRWLGAWLLVRTLCKPYAPCVSNPVQVRFASVAPAFAAIVLDLLSLFLPTLLALETLLWPSVFKLSCPAAHDCGRAGDSRCYA